MAAGDSTGISLHIASRATCLCADVEVADTFLSRFRGLLGRQSLPRGRGLWLRPSTGVHTLGMYFPIDIVGLAKDLTVVLLQRNLEPWRIGALDRRTHSVLELPAGVIACTGVQVGDRITVESRSLQSR